MVSSEQKPLKVVVSLMRPGSTSSLGLKGECLELLNHLADAPQALAELEQDGIIPPLLTLVRTPDLVIEASAAELLAKLAQVRVRVRVGVGVRVRVRVRVRVGVGVRVRVRPSYWRSSRRSTSTLTLTHPHPNTPSP